MSGRDTLKVTQASWLFLIHCNALNGKKVEGKTVTAVATKYNTLVQDWVKGRSMGI